MNRPPKEGHTKNLLGMGFIQDADYLAPCKLEVAAAARRVAECLEKDMTSTLATKQDLVHLQQLMNAQFLAHENRIIFRLGALMVVLFGLAVTVFKLLG